MDTRVDASSYLCAPRRYQGIREVLEYREIIILAQCEGQGEERDEDDGEEEAHIKGE